jgi:uncharacterized protein YggT (Ycf19 family)
MILWVELWDTINYVSANIIYMFSKVYILAIEFRFLVQFFLQINPYYEPFLTLWVWTNPVFNAGRKYYPKLVGIDFCPMINFALLKNLSDFFYQICIRYSQRDGRIS